MCVCEWICLADARSANWSFSLEGHNQLGILCVTLRPLVRSKLQVLNQAGLSTEDFFKADSKIMQVGTRMYTCCVLFVVQELIVVDLGLKLRTRYIINYCLHFDLGV